MSVTLIDVVRCCLNGIFEVTSIRADLSAHARVRYAIEFRRDFRSIEVFGIKVKKISDYGIDGRKVFAFDSNQRHAGQSL